MTKPKIVGTNKASMELELFIRCPSCGTIGIIDEDQFKGEVSIDCPECPYHETHDLREES